MAQGSVRGHRDLRVWRESMELAMEVYRIARNLPDEERYGLASQMKRAVVSVVSNIAEGAGRNSSSEFARFLSIASGSLSELETQLLLSDRLGFIKISAQLQARLRFVRTMLTRLSDAVRLAAR